MGPQDDARHVMEPVQCVLAARLPLQTAEEKSGLSHATEGRRFLGDEVRMSSGERRRTVQRRDSPYDTRSRTIAQEGQRHVPLEKVRTFCPRKGYGDRSGLRALPTPAWRRRRDVAIMQA